MEVKAKSGELKESTDSDFTDISFEELLAQEKKDSFWLVYHLLIFCLRLLLFLISQVFDGHIIHNHVQAEK